jgi:hypothetical protein
MLQGKRPAKGERTRIQLKLIASHITTTEQKWTNKLICYQAFVRPGSMLLLQDIYEVIAVEVRVGRHPWNYLTE